MSQPRLWQASGWFLIGTGALWFLIYPLHELAGFAVAPATTRMTYYSLATFGAAAIAWGLVLLRAAQAPDLRLATALPTAFGFGLLAMMRVLTLAGGGEALDVISAPAFRVPVAATEIGLFGFLAYRFGRGCLARGAG